MNVKAVSEAAGMLVIARLRQDFRNFRRINVPMKISAIYLGRDEYYSVRFVDPNACIELKVWTQVRRAMEFRGVPIYKVADDSHYGLGWVVK